MIDFVKIGVVVLLLDSIYINIILKNYLELIKDVQGNTLQINFLGAILCYACIIFMLHYFIIKENKPIKDAFILGLCTYGIYEFTNMAILNKWTSPIIYIDVVWGGILYALTTHIIQSKYI
jgi:uncharacterized membrane protein